MQQKVAMHRLLVMPPDTIFQPKNGWRNYLGSVPVTQCGTILLFEWEGTKHLLTRTLLGLPLVVVAL